MVATGGLEPWNIFYDKSSQRFVRGDTKKIDELNRLKQKGSNATKGKIAVDVTSPTYLQTIQPSIRFNAEQLTTPTKGVLSFFSGRGKISDLYSSIRSTNY